jgi:transcriptional regulator with XRE-family HTH domain
MSRRPLAHLSGVDHSTISRLIHGQRMPSLETAASLARVLPVLEEHPLPIPTLQVGSARQTSAPARVEYALRRDELLTGDDVRAVMAIYLEVRASADRKASQPTEMVARDVRVHRLGRPQPTAPQRPAVPTVFPGTARRATTLPADLGSRAGARSALP